jgi:hypothetical protein
MIVGKVTRVANPAGRSARSAARKRVSAANPAHMLTLGFINPKRRTSVAKRAKKRNGARASSKARSRMRKNGKRRNSIIVMPRSNHRRGRRNPVFFGSNVSPVKLAEYVAAGLVGVTVNRAIVAALPVSVTGNNIFATAAALGIALVQWWLGSMASKDIGAAFGFGGLMNAGNQALNAFVPSVGSVISLSGRRSLGDFVPGRFSIPENPVLGNNPITGMAGAYPIPYGRAA